MTEQHDHAILSENIANYWREDLYLNFEKKTSVQFAISQHDCAWVDVDEAPIWNDKIKKPYTFIDYPISLKLHFYKKGIDKIQGKGKYAALLCSMHYVSFFEGITNDPRIGDFMDKEKWRQKQILQKLHLKIDKNIIFHYQLLRFCDSILLFLCMHKAGIDIKSLPNWFEKGIVQPFHFFNESYFQMKWLDNRRITIDPFPFSMEFEVSIPTREVTKTLVEKLGILDAFHKTPKRQRNVLISSFQ